MKPGLPVSIALHAAVLGWALVSFASMPPMEAPASDPIDVELLPPSQTTQQKLGSKTGKPSEEIKKETAAAPKETTGNRAGTTKSEEPPPPPPEQKPTPPAEKPQAAAATPPVPETKPEPPKPEPPKPVAEVKPPPPPTPPPPPKPEPAKEPDKPKEPAEKPVEAKQPPLKPQPPKDEKALEKLLEEAKKPEKPVEKKPETPKPPAKTEPVKLASNDPKSASTPTQKPSTLRGQQTDIVNRVETGANAGKAQQHSSLGNPNGPAANVKLSQSELEGLIGALRSQIAKCWNPPPGASESGVTVRVAVALNQDGTLRAPPALEGSSDPGNPMSGAIATTALRAVRMCASEQPFKLPADKYAAWAVNHITFDPRNQ
jgi:hypothetical protein